MVQTANTIFRDFETDGVPASGKHQPKKSEIRPLLTRLENIYDGALAGGALVYKTKADLTADTTQADNAMAWVLGDDTVANNGIYQFDGAAWNRLGDLPYSYIKASNAGAGTANAIVATTSIPIPAADGGALIALPVVADNTAKPVTVSFNGGVALTVKTSSGNDVSVGGLTAGMIAAGYVSGTTFRLLTDQAGAAIVADAEAAADRAETAAKNIDGATLANGYIKVTDAAYGAAGDGIINDTAAVSAAVAAAYASGINLYWPAGSYLTTASIPHLHAVKHSGPGVIKRSTDVFYIEPNDLQTSSLYVAPTGGDDDNDGISPEEAFATWQGAFDALSSRGYLNGNWEIVGAAGSHDCSAGEQDFIAPSKNPVVIRGPAVSTSSGIVVLVVKSISGAFTAGETITGGTSGATATVLSFAAHKLEVTAKTGVLFQDEVVTGTSSGASATVRVVSARPTCILDGGGDGANYLHGLIARGAGVNVEFRDLFVKDFSQASGNARLGLMGDSADRVYFNNCHSLNCSWFGAYMYAVQRGYIYGGVYDGSNDDTAVGAGANCSHLTLGAVSTPVGLINCGTGALWSRGTQGHIDYCVMADNIYDVVCWGGARAHGVQNDHIASSIGVNCYNGGVYFPDSDEWNAGTGDGVDQRFLFRSFGGDEIEMSDAFAKIRVAYDRSLRQATAAGSSDLNGSIYTIPAYRLFGATGGSKEVEIELVGLLTCASGDSFELSIGGVSATMTVVGSAPINQTFTIKARLFEAEGIPGSYRLVSELQQSGQAPRIAGGSGAFDPTADQTVSASFTAAGTPAVSIWNSRVWIVG